MIAIPNMERPESCWECFYIECDHWGEHGYDNSADCPLIEIVRCGECMHRHEHEWYNTCDKHIGNGFGDDYFCKYGERRADEID